MAASKPATGLPCAMVLTVSFALSLGSGLSCPRRRAIISRDLVSASGGQDHTPSPSASASFVRVPKARATPTRPSHPALNVRDDREAPLLSERGTARIMLLISGKVRLIYEKQEMPRLRQIGTTGSLRMVRMRRARSVNPSWPNI
jgi:hypothetical protein